MIDAMEFILNNWNRRTAERAASNNLLELTISQESTEDVLTQLVDIANLAFVTFTQVSLLLAGLEIGREDDSPEETSTSEM